MQAAESILLFGGHLGFGLRGFVRLACEMQQAVDNDTVQFVEEWCAYLFGVGGNGVERDVDIAIHACARGIIKGDDVGIVVVLEKLLIDGKDLLVVAEDIVEVAHKVAVLSCGALDPLFDFAKVDS